MISFAHGITLGMLIRMNVQNSVSNIKYYHATYTDAVITSNDSKIFISKKCTLEQKTSGIRFNTKTISLNNSNNIFSDNILSRSSLWFDYRAHE